MNRLLKLLDCLSETYRGKVYSQVNLFPMTAKTPAPNRLLSKTLGTRLTDKTLRVSTFI